MSGWQIKFPLSRTCLWDSTSSGEASELSMTNNGWLFVQISSSSLQLALNHARSSVSKTIECFMIASSWINEAEGITLEVNRFDPGHPNKERTGLVPTSLMPRDIAVKTQVVFGALPESKYLTHNLNNLQVILQDLRHRLFVYPTLTLDPSRLLSLRIHCSYSHNGSLTVQCGCVLPTLSYQATPIRDIPIASTALARNLGGPLPLSALQGQIKYGFITMEMSRKLVLLLHSDPIVSSFPLIGVWVSGVSSISHPLVWTACAAYTNSARLTDRVWGEGGTFITLVYCEGCSRPYFLECQMKEGPGTERPDFEISTGEAVIQLSSEHTLIGVKLDPAPEFTALHTLMETALTSTPSNKEPLSSITSQTCDIDSSLCDSPVPSPLPMPTQAPERVARDKNLSVISSLSINERSYLNDEVDRDRPAQLDRDTTASAVSHSSVQQQETTPIDEVPPHTRQQYDQQLKLIQEEVNCLLQAQSPSAPKNGTIHTADAATNTGMSLCWPSATATPNTHSTSEQDEEESIEPLAVNLSTMTASTLLSQSMTNMHLDLHSFAHSSSATPSHSFGDSASMSGPGDQEELVECQLSPIESNFHNKQWSTEDILADTFEKLQVLENLQTKRRGSPLTDSQSFSHRGSESGSRLIDVSNLSVPGESEKVQYSFSGVHGSSLLSGSGKRCEVGCDDFSGTQSENRMESKELRNMNSSEHFCRSNGVEGSSSSPHSGRDAEKAEGDDDKTPTPPRYKNQADVNSTFPQDTEGYNTNGCHPYPQPPFLTPLSAKNGSMYHLHPDVLHQHYSPDITMLPIPHILCPDNMQDTMLLTAMMGNDYTLDENFHNAEMISRRYLGMSGSRNHSESGCINEDLLTLDADSADQTFANNMSMATHQYFQRHNLMAPKSVQRVNIFSPVQEEQTREKIGTNDTLDIQTLKTLPKLT